MRSSLGPAFSLLYLLSFLCNAQILVPLNETCPVPSEVVNTIYQIDPVYFNTYIESPTTFSIFEDITIAPESLPTNITIATYLTATGYQTITVELGEGGVYITPSGQAPPTVFASTTSPVAGTVPSAPAVVVGTQAVGRLGGYFAASSTILPGGIAETIPGLTLETCVNFCVDYAFFAVTDGTLLYQQ